MNICTHGAFSLFCQNFFFGGRLVFGPDVASLTLSVLLIAVPAMAFCIKVYAKLQHVSDVTKTEDSIWYPVLIVASLLTVLVSTLFSFLSPVDMLTFPERNSLPYPPHLAYTILRK